MVIPGFSIVIGITDINKQTCMIAEVLHILYLTVKFFINSHSQNSVTIYSYDMYFNYVALIMCMFGYLL